MRHTTDPIPPPYRLAIPAEVANLRSWLAKHLAWLDGEFAKLAGGGSSAAGSPAPLAGR